MNTFATIRLFIFRIRTPESLSEFSEPPLEYRLTGGFCEIEEVFDIMQWGENSARCLTDIHEMTQISEWVSFRDRRLMFWKHRDFFLAHFIFFSSDFDIAIRTKRLTMTTNTSRKHTVEHIDSACNPLDDILWSPHTHEIVWLRFWKYWCQHIENPIHILFRLPYW